MNIIFAINHPAHYHLFKNSFKELKQKKHNPVFAIKDKDILEQLMNSEKVEFIRLTYKRKARSVFSTIFKGFLEILIQDVKLFGFVRKFKPDIMIGTDYSITHIGMLCRIPSIVMNEDDYELNKLFCLLSYPFASAIVSPTLCSVGKYKKKKINYDGYQKLAYLHPAVFRSNINIVNKYFDLTKKYFLIRTVSLSAGHDIHLTGIDYQTLEKIINILSQHGNVYIINETKIPSALERYKLNIDVKDIHHILAFASLFISDGQSMIVEAAILGTPSIRFNSLTGKISVLEELENHYGLTTKIHNSRPDLLLAKINELLKSDDLNSEYLKQREKMISEKINVSQFLTWLIENYPKNRNQIMSNPQNIQLKFKNDVSVK